MDTIYTVLSKKEQRISDNLSHTLLSHKHCITSGAAERTASSHTVPNFIPFPSPYPPDSTHTIKLDSQISQ